MKHFKRRMAVTIIFTVMFFLFFNTGETWERVGVDTFERKYWTIKTHFFSMSEPQWNGNKMVIWKMPFSSHTPILRSDWMNCQETRKNSFSCILKVGIGQKRLLRHFSIWAIQISSNLPQASMDGKMQTNQFCMESEVWSLKVMLQERRLHHSLAQRQGFLQPSDVEQHRSYRQR